MPPVTNTPQNRGQLTTSSDRSNDAFASTTRTVKFTSGEQLNRTIAR
jgi:hypothetical protein